MLTVNQRITLTIHSLGSSGEGVGYFEGIAIFVDGALPGEEIQARLYECRKRYGKAKLISLLKPSPERVKPLCPVFETCGGCQIMHLAYDKQLINKRQRVLDAMQRIGKLEVQVEACIPSPKQMNYRNKIQLPVRAGKNGLVLGLYARSSHNIIEVDSCGIHCALGEKVLTEIRLLLQHSKITAYKPETGRGDLRHVLIRSALNTDEVLVILVTSCKQNPLLDQLAKEIPYVKGVVQNINQTQGNVILGEQYRVLNGRGFIYEKLLDLKFKVSPASFFQVNPAQAEQLYTQALAYAQLTGEETVFDAYCGVGTLSLVFAQKAKKVIGVECVPEAIEDAKENAALNAITNVDFHCQDAEKFIHTLESIDVILLNPPRKGCEASFLEGIKKLKPKRVVYISCDPATLARDLAILASYGYQIDGIQPFDMFPQTAHVECVAKLTLR